MPSLLAAVDAHVGMRLIEADRVPTLRIARDRQAPFLSQDGARAQRIAQCKPPIVRGLQMIDAESQHDESDGGADAPGDAADGEPCQTGEGQHLHQHRLLRSEQVLEAGQGEDGYGQRQDKQRGRTGQPRTPLPQQPHSGVRLLASARHEQVQITAQGQGQGRQRRQNVGGTLAAGRREENKT